MDDGDDLPTLRSPTNSANQIKHDDKSEKYFVKLKLRRDPTLSTLDIYEFNISFLTIARRRIIYCPFVNSI